MTAANVIILAEIFISVIGILFGLRYVVRGSSVSLRTLSILLVLFCGTLVTALIYSHSLVNAASRENVVEKKISTLSEAVRLNPTASLYTSRAEALAAAGEADKALRDVARAIAIAPGNAEANRLREKLSVPQPRYTITDLGTLGGDRSLAYGINSLGHITGFSELPGNPSAGFHAFLYDGQMHDLGALNDSPHNAPRSMSSGAKINDSDQVVGNTYGDVGGATAFVWDAANGMRSLGFPNTYGVAINNKGQILVQASTIVPEQPVPAFLFHPATGREVIPPLASQDGCFPNVSAVNDSGVVVGYCERSKRLPSVLQAFVWDSTHGTQVLDSPGSIQSIARSMNSKGRISGEIGVKLGVGRAVTWDTSSGLQMLPLVTDRLERTLNTGAYSINDQGYIVGMGSVLIDSRGVIQNGVLWIGSVGYLLDNLIPPSSGWHLIEATAINNAGQIAGYGEVEGKTHAFRLDPVSIQ